MLKRDTATKTTPAAKTVETPVAAVASTQPEPRYLRCRVPLITVRARDGYGKTFGLDDIVNVHDVMTTLTNEPITIADLLGDRIVDCFELVVEPESPSPVADITETDGKSGSDA